MSREQNDVEYVCSEVLNMVVSEALVLCKNRIGSSDKGSASLVQKLDDFAKLLTNGDSTVTFFVDSKKSRLDGILVTAKPQFKYIGTVAEEFSDFYSAYQHFLISRDKGLNYLDTSNASTRFNRFDCKDYALSVLDNGYEHVLNSAIGVSPENTSRLQDGYFNYTISKSDEGLVPLVQVYMSYRSGIYEGALGQILFKSGDGLTSWLELQLQDLLAFMACSYGHISRDTFVITDLAISHWSMHTTDRSVGWLFDYSYKVADQSQEELASFKITQKELNETPENLNNAYSKFPISAENRATIAKVLKRIASYLDSLGEVLEDKVESGASDDIIAEYERDEITADRFAYLYICRSNPSFDEEWATELPILSL